MDAEIIKLDQEGKQNILNYHRYQKNENKSDSYRCVNRKCGDSFYHKTMKRNQIEHYHSQMSQCEVDCLVQLKSLMQLVSVDHDIRLEEAHNRHYQLLTEKYLHKEFAEFWKPFIGIKCSLRYHTNKTKPKNPKSVHDIEINNVYATINYEPFLQFDN
ncbi:hypothetical protein BpHYR1_010382 [Brachionus plicatilis]|uniref:Uncharacterized protein n=1 Tax=Brachionus plicatilis TaxID=10195 RepID=A0A3M7SW03_BRAPC|nr:hypothetical protein BpHYR1_010382 [Brachionus plicatilis]